MMMSHLPRQECKGKNILEIDSLRVGEEMKVLILAALFALGIGVMLLWKTTTMTKDIYRIAFFLGLVVFAATMLFLPSSLTINLGRSPGSPILAILLTLVQLTPFILLLESGYAGYRG